MGQNRRKNLEKLITDAATIRHKPVPYLYGKTLAELKATLERLLAMPIPPPKPTIKRLREPLATLEQMLLSETKSGLACVLAR